MPFDENYFQAKGRLEWTLVRLFFNCLIIVLLSAIPLGLYDPFGRFRLITLRRFDATFAAELDHFELENDDLVQVTLYLFCLVGAIMCGVTVFMWFSMQWHWNSCSTAMSVLIGLGDLILFFVFLAYGIRQHIFINRLEDDIKVSMRKFPNWTQVAIYKELLPTVMKYGQSYEDFLVSSAWQFHYLSTVFFYVLRESTIVLLRNVRNAIKEF